MKKAKMFKLKSYSWESIIEFLPNTFIRSIEDHEYKKKFQELVALEHRIKSKELDRMFILEDLLKVFMRNKRLRIIAVRYFFRINKHTSDLGRWEMYTCILRSPFKTKLALCPMDINGDDVRLASMELINELLEDAYINKKCFTCPIGANVLLREFEIAYSCVTAIFQPDSSYYILKEFIDASAETVHLRKRYEEIKEWETNRLVYI